MSAEKVPVWGSLQAAEVPDGVILGSTLISMGSAVKVTWSLVHGRMLLEMQQPPYCLPYTITLHSVWGRGIVALVYTNFWKITVLPYLLPNVAKWALQQVKDARRKWRSAVHYVKCWSNPFMPIWQVTFLGGFSTTPQKLIKYNKQISFISRGRIVINQVRALQLSARPHPFTHWASDFKDGMKWQNRWVGNLSVRSFWHAPSSNTACHPVCCFARVHVFAKLAWFPGIGH